MSLEKAKELYLKAWKSELLTLGFSNSIIKACIGEKRSARSKWLLNKLNFTLMDKGPTLKGKPMMTIEMYSFSDTELWEFMAQIRSLSPEEFKELSNTLGRRVQHPKHDKYFKKKLI